ncbi:MAG: restriction endonuclease subunit S [Muribaculaceae bacterium]|nr:restriction endonuclease subunit S [Muribaculaceae bacterium]
MILNKINISETIGGRLDSKFFNPKYVQIIKTISAVNHCCLSDVATFSSESWNQEDYFETTFPYIEIGAVDTITGEILNIATVEKKKAPSRAKKIARRNDIIVSTTRPNRGAISMINGDMYIVSTGFSIIRDISNCILRDYLFIVLRLHSSLEQMMQRSSGGNYPAITEEELKKILIPLPPIKVQQQIVDIYTTAQRTKQAKEEQANTLLDSIDDYLLSQLGIILPTKDNSHIEDANYKIKLSGLLGKRYDPYYHNPYFYTAFQELNKSKFHLQSLGEISTLITSGMTPKSGGDAYTNAENGVAFIRSGDIDISGEIDFDNLLYIKHEVHNTTMKSSHVKDNDIMIAIVGATIGQVGIYHSNKEANINQAIALVRLNDGYSSEYIKEVIKSSIGQLNLDRLKRPVARANINLDEISSMQIPIPDINIQNAIVDNIVLLRERAKLIKEEGNTSLMNAKAQIEKMILG